MKLYKLKVLRETWEGSDVSLNKLVALAAAFQADGTGLKLYVCADISTVDIGTGVTFTSETLAYNYGVTSGAHVMTALLPYIGSIYAVECGNEMTRKDGLCLNSVYEGTAISDFNNAKWPMLRGSISGCMDGVKSVSPTTLIASNAFTFSEFAAAFLLFNGWNPDGTSGYRAINWDITALHSYQAWNDPENTYYDGGGTPPTFNYLAWMAMLINKPMVISEWNTDADNSGTTTVQKQAWVLARANAFYKNRDLYNLQCIMYYDLFTGPWNMLDGTSFALTPLGTTYTNAILANPADAG